MYNCNHGIDSAGNDPAVIVTDAGSDVLAFEKNDVIEPLYNELTGVICAKPVNPPNGVDSASQYS